jgi:predicted MFS family arabinose efflux permease
MQNEESTSYKWFVVFILFVVYTFNFLDRQLLSTLQEPIKNELGLSDSQLGLMTGFLFALFYTAFGVIVGFMADRTNRKVILFIGCTLWSLFTVASGFAKNFTQMAVARVGVGVGEAAGAPPSYSIISDYFPTHRRALALAIFSLGIPTGIALGAGFGAKIHELLGWRQAFIYIGLAGTVAGLVMFLLVKEPKRGRLDSQTDQNQQKQPSFFETARNFFTNPVLAIFAMASGASAFFSYATLNWNASFLLRVQGMEMADLAVYYAMTLVISLGTGIFLSGLIIDLLVKRSPAWYGLVPMFAMILNLPTHYLYVQSDNWQTAIIWLGFASFFSSFYLAPTLAVIQNNTPPEQRTMAGALLLMTLNLIGLGGGPTIVGFMSDYFAQTLGAAEGLRLALFWVLPSTAISAILYFLGARLLSSTTRN